MLTSLGRFAMRWAQGPLWSPSVGLARTLLACVALSTMLFTPMSSVIRPGAGLNPPQCDGLLGVSLWCLVPASSYELTRWVVIVVLAVVASGYRPRFTAIPLWWVLFSNQASWVSVDGGDQVAAVLALLLIPHSLTDRRRWHWSTDEVTSAKKVGARAIVARALILAVQVQMSWIYIDASISKLAVPE